jgi:hypothetical protein
MLGQNFPPPESMKDFSDGMVCTPNTAMVITPTNVPPPDPNQNVPGDPTMTPPPAPYAPDTFGDGSTYEGPIGVTGYVGDTVTTGCSYSALGHSASRVVDDIVVPGSVGKYPLKMTRYYNSRQQYALVGRTSIRGFFGAMGPGLFLPTATFTIFSVARRLVCLRVGMTGTRGATPAAMEFGDLQTVEKWCSRVVALQISTIRTILGLGLPTPRPTNSSKSPSPAGDACGLPTVRLLTTPKPMEHNC